MNPKPLSQARDEDARNVTAALQRARIIAAQTQTDIVIVRNGKLIREIPKDQKTKSDVKHHKNGSTSKYRRSSL